MRHPVFQRGAVVPALVGGNAAGLPQPRQRMPPGVYRHRAQQPRHADSDIDPRFLRDETDIFPIFANQQQPVGQRRRDVQRTAHIVAPWHKGPRQKRPPPVGMLGIPQRQRHQQDQQRHRAKTDHAGAVAHRKGNAQNIPRQPHKVDGGHHRRKNSRRAGAAQHHIAHRQRQQLIEQPGEEVRREHAAREGVSHRQQHRRHRVQLPHAQIDREIPVGDLPGQHAPHRVVVLEITVGDVVGQIGSRHRAPHRGHPDKQRRQRQPWKERFQPLFQLLRHLIGTAPPVGPAFFSSRHGHPPGKRSPPRRQGPPPTRKTAG